MDCHKGIRKMSDCRFFKISKLFLIVCVASLILSGATTGFAFNGCYVSVWDTDDDEIVYTNPIVGPLNSHVMVVDKDDDTFGYTEISDDRKKRVSEVPPLDVLRRYPEIIKARFKKQWDLARKDVAANQYRKVKMHAASDRKSAKSAVVTVLTSVGSGTGFLITRTGFIITNAHVVSKNKDDFVDVKFLDGRVVAARLVKIDNMRDVALLKIDGADMKYLLLGNSNTCNDGDRVTAIGSPGGPKFTKLQGTIMEGLVTEGNITDASKNLHDREYSYIQSNTFTDHGSSGGPLLNDHLEVIGINSRGRGDIYLRNQSGKMVRVNVGGYWRYAVSLFFNGEPPKDASFAIPVNNIKGFIAE